MRRFLLDGPERLHLVAVAALLLAPGPAAAQSEDWDDWYDEPASIQIRVCNESGRNATVAISYMEVGTTDYFTHKGWFNVAAGECRDIAKTSNKIFYMYADATDGSDRVWQGNHSLCVEYPGPYTFTTHMSATECGYGQDVREFDRLESTGAETFTWKLQ